jgi:squalene-associated FAD-dependent desaturase
MELKTITIIGGGIAGLSAAVFLAQKNFNIRLVEGSPKFGGRAYSFYDKSAERYFDNGQHILAGWYKNTFEYLKLIGTFNKLNFQRALEINFVDRNRDVYKLRCPKVFAPLNIILGLWRFNGFSFWDKIKLINILKIVNKEKYSDEMLSEMTVKELLVLLRQSNNSIVMFWNPFIYAVFNASADNVSAFVFVNVLKIGFTKINHSNLVIPNVDLNNLLINNAIEYLLKNDVEIRNNLTVKEFKVTEDNIEYLLLENGEQVYSDYFISAVSFFSFSKLFETHTFKKYFTETDKLVPSSIVSIHLFFEDDIPENVLENNSFGMTGLLNTNIQWVFKRGRRHLSLVISGADFESNLSEKSQDEIYKMCLSELSECLDGFSKLKVTGYKVIKEKRATFIPDISSNNYRCKQKTGIENLFIAGDWTDTKLPSTIESAVKSSKAIVEIFS